MSTYLHYQAMPEGSRLFRRLRTEQRLCVMYCNLIHHPRGPFDSYCLEKWELDDLLNQISRDPLLDTRSVVDQVFTDLLGELESADREYTGLRHRSEYLQACDSFETSLAEVLGNIGIMQAEELTYRIVMGNDRLVEEGWGNGNVTLQLVPSSLVREVADMFSKFNADSMADWNDEFAMFRRVYDEAAKRSEAIVIA